MEHQRKLTPLVLGTCLLAAVSCGNDDDSSSSSITPPQQEEQTDDGNFTATLNTLNPGVGGNAATGTASISVAGDEIQIRLDMIGTPARITHVQHIHSLSACPTMARDVNADGFLDVVEGVPDYGPILIPLDGDLNSQAGGMATNPMANRSGVYSYSETASLARMLADLQAPDLDTTDVVIKLQPGEDLNLAGRHFVIHGVPASTNLPDSVASIHGLPGEATLPIACGTITRVTDGGTTTGGTGSTGGTTTGGTTTGGTTTGGTTTGGTTTGGTATGGTATTGTTTGL